MFAHAPFILGSAAGTATICMLIGLVLRARHRSRYHLEGQRIAALRQKIDDALRDAAGSRQQESFSASLKVASLTTSLQQPRLDTMAKIDKQPPEKYRILARLASQGMSATEIASILDISQVEAGQLLRLCSMSRTGLGEPLVPTGLQ